MKFGGFIIHKIKRTKKYFFFFKMATVQTFEAACLFLEKGLRHAE